MRQAVISDCLDGFAMYEGSNLESVSDDFHAFVFVTFFLSQGNILLPFG